MRNAVVRGLNKSVAALVVTLFVFLFPVSDCLSGDPVREQFDAWMRDAKSEDHEIQSNAWRELFKIAYKNPEGLEPYVEPLIDALKDKDLAFYATHLLGMKGDPRAVEPLLNLYDTLDTFPNDVNMGALKVQLSQTLGKFRDPRAVDVTIMELKSENPSARSMAAKELAQTKSPHSVEPLINLLRENNESSEAAALVLGEIRDPRAYEPLMGVLQSLQKSETRGSELEHSVVSALVQFSDPRSTDALIVSWQYFLESEAATADSRIEMLTEIAKVGDSRVLGLLTFAMKDRNLRVREQAVRAIANINDPATLEPLVVALQDGYWKIRKEAVLALGKIEGAEVVEPLIYALKDPDYAIRESAAQGLGRLKDPRAIKPLIAALEDENPDVRRNVALALGDYQDSKVVEPFLEALLDSHWKVRRDTATALGKIKDKKSVPFLIGALKDKNPEVRVAVVLALGEVGDQRAMEPLKAALKDEDATVAANAEKAIKKIKSK